MCIRDSYDRVLDQLRERYGKGVVPLTIPIGHENSLRRWIGLLVVLNPISIPVTGMHGNFDGLLAVFIGMALLMAIDNRPIASGIWLGLAANLKVSPILLTPVFFFWWWHRGRMWSFTVTAAATILAGWSPGLIQCPKLFLERVLALSLIHI